MRTSPAVLSVHVLDPLGEEGLLADAAVCRELQCRPLAVVSGVLVGDPDGSSLQALSAESLARQLRRSLSGQRPNVVRVGLLCDPAQVHAEST